MPKATNPHHHKPTFRRKHDMSKGVVKSSHTILLTLDSNKRYAHTAACQYRITMASMQPDERRLPHCVCNAINEERRQKTRVDQNTDRTVVIVEHNLSEYILCVLNSDKQKQCKLSLEIQPGEQVAFRTIGKTPVLLSGVSCEPIV